MFFFYRAATSCLHFSLHSTLTVCESDTHVTNRDSCWSEITDRLILLLWVQMIFSCYMIFFFECIIFSIARFFGLATMEGEKKKREKKETLVWFFPLCEWSNGRINACADLHLFTGNTLNVWGEKYVCNNHKIPLWNHCNLPKVFADMRNWGGKVRQRVFRQKFGQTRNWDVSSFSLDGFPPASNITVSQTLSNSQSAQSSSRQRCRQKSVLQPGRQIAG